MRMPGNPDERTREASAPRLGPLFRLIRDQRIAFLIVGAFNTAIGYLLFVVFDLTVGQALRPQIGPAAASIVTLVCAHIVATVIAFVLHRNFVFRVRGHVVRDFLRFQAVYLVTFGINIVVLPLLVLVGIPSLLAQALITVVTVVVSWFGHKYFSFRRPAAQAAPPEPGTIDEAERGVL